MTKAEEIAILDATIAALGPHSYLGPWLADARAGIVADICNDFGPSAALPGAARKEGADLLTRAREEAGAIREDARKRAAAEMQKAYDEAGAVRSGARLALERLAGSLGR